MYNIMHSRKIGKILIGHEDFINDLLVVRKIMDRIIVLNASWDYAIDAVQYTCYCDAFRELEDGEMIPSYLICINDYNKQNPKISFVALKDGAFLPGTRKEAE